MIAHVAVDGRKHFAAGGVEILTVGSGFTYVLGAAEGDTGDARDELQAELANGLAGLLLATGVDSDGSTGGNVGLIASLGARVRGAILDGLGDLVIVDFFNAGISHFCDLNEPKNGL